MSAASLKQGHMLLGLAWTILGVVGTTYYALGAWRAWTEIPGATFPETIISYLLLATLSLVVLLAGAGYLAHKRWARLMTVVMSPLFLIYSLGSVASAVFLYIVREDTGAGPAARAFIVTAVLVPVSLYTLKRFFRDRGPSQDRH